MSGQHDPAEVLFHCFFFSTGPLIPRKQPIERFVPRQGQFAIGRDAFEAEAEQAEQAQEEDRGGEARGHRQPGIPPANGAQGLDQPIFEAGLRTFVGEETVDFLIHLLPLGQGGGALGTIRQVPLGPFAFLGLQATARRNRPECLASTSVRTWQSPIKNKKRKIKMRIKSKNEIKSKRKIKRRIKARAASLTLNLLLNLNPLPNLNLPLTLSLFFSFLSVLSRHDLFHLRPHHLEPPVQQTSQGAVGEAHFDLDRRQIRPGQVTQGQGQAILLRQRPQHGQHLLPHLRAGHRLARTRRLRGQIFRHGRFQVHVALASLAVPVGVDGRVLSDPQQPGRNFAGASRLDSERNAVRKVSCNRSSVRWASPVSR